MRFLINRCCKNIAVVIEEDDPNDLHADNNPIAEQEESILHYEDAESDSASRKLAI